MPTPRFYLASLKLTLRTIILDWQMGRIDATDEVCFQVKRLKETIAKLESSLVQLL